MWVLVEIEDTVRLAPGDLNVREVEGLAREVERKYSNKILPNIGIAIKLFDILQVKEAIVYQGDGGGFATVRFRLVVFKPEVREVVVGLVKEMGSDGVRVSLGFFDQIYIDGSSFPEGTTFDPVTGTWQWSYGDHTLLVEIGFPIRFEVREVDFALPSTKRRTKGPETEPAAPLMVISGSCVQSGLGMVKWWGKLNPLPLDPDQHVFTYYGITFDDETPDVNANADADHMDQDGAEGEGGSAPEAQGDPEALLNLAATDDQAPPAH